MRSRFFILLTSFCLLTLSFTACKNNSKEKLLGSVCDTSSVGFSTFVNPFMTSKCLSCHSAANAASLGGGTDLEGYDNMKVRSAAILSSMTRTVNPMPKNAATIDACNITRFKSWINQGYPN